MTLILGCVVHLDVLFVAGGGGAACYDDVVGEDGDGGVGAERVVERGEEGVLASEGVGEEEAEGGGRN